MRLYTNTTVDDTTCIPPIPCSITRVKSSDYFPKSVAVRVRAASCARNCCKSDRCRVSSKVRSMNVGAKSLRDLQNRRRLMARFCSFGICHSSPKIQRQAAATYSASPVLIIDFVFDERYAPAKQPVEEVLKCLGTGCSKAPGRIEELGGCRESACDFAKEATLNIEALSVARNQCDDFARLQCT